MTKSKTNGPLEVEVGLCGRAPDLQGEPDFTVESVRLNEGFTLDWQTVSAGFGQLRFYGADGGVIRCNNETMSRAFVRAVLVKLAEQIELDD